MARGGGFRKLGALVAIAGMFGAAAPSSVAAKSAVAIAEAPQALVSRQFKLNHLRIPGLSISRPSGFIWVARAKRGNRRARSHWDYNR